MNTTTIQPVYQRVQPWQGKPVTTTGIPEPEAVWEWLKQGTIILWTHAGIAVGTLQAGEKAPNWLQGETLAHLDWGGHLVELRAFNESKEWRVLQNGKGRKRVDFPGVLGDPEAVDSKMALRGVVAECLQTGEETLTLHSRHYMGQNALGMTVYEDVRFVGIGEAEEGGKV